MSVRKTQFVQVDSFAKKESARYPNATARNHVQKESFAKRGVVSPVKKMKHAAKEKFVKREAVSQPVLKKTLVPKGKSVKRVTV